MITYKIKIGKGMLEFSGNSMKDIHKWGNIWGAIPEKCSCGKDNIYLGYMATKEGYEYLKVKCKDCGATYTIKQNRAGEYYVDADEKFETYGGGSREAPPNFDDIPY